MAEPVDYTKRPYAFYYTKIESEIYPRLTRPFLELWRARFLPWDQPDTEEHRQKIREAFFEEAGKPAAEKTKLIILPERIHDPELGNIPTEFTYFDPRQGIDGEEFYSKMPSHEGVVSVGWSKPTAAQLNALARSRKCVVIENEARLYSLWSAAGEAFINLVSINLKLIRKGNLKIETDDPQSSNIAEGFVRARDPEYGIIKMLYVVTDKPSVFESLRQNEDNLAIAMNRAAQREGLTTGWEQSANEYVRRHFLYLFKNRPTSDQLLQEKKKYGFIIN